MKDTHSREVVILGNWKMNHTAEMAKRVFQDLTTSIHSQAPLEKALRSGKLVAGVFPTALCLPSLSREKKSTPLVLGSQNTHWAPEGAYTGEVSTPMLEEFGIHWSLVGHSERRQFFGETDSSAGLRTEHLIHRGFHVVLCIGETLKERDSGET